MATSIDLTPYDDARHCYLAAERKDLCVSTSNPCWGGGAVDEFCAIDPDGRLYVVFHSTDNDLTAKGWRFVHDRHYVLPPLPPEMRPTTADLERCARAHCAPSCDGTPPPPSICGMADAARDIGTESASD